MVELELALNVIRNLGILVGIVVAVYEIINIRRTRKMEYLTRLSNNWTSLESNRIWIDVMFQQQFSTYEEWRENYSTVINPEAGAKMLAVLNATNNIGSLVKNKLIDLDFVWQSHPPITLIGLWQKVKPLVEYWRISYNDPEFYTSLEYLCTETKKKHPETRYLPGDQETELRERLLKEWGKG